MRINRLLKQFNWRFVLVRILVNALALAITAAIVPKIYFVDKSVLNWLLMAIMLGILNALLKPILQFLTLQFLFVTFGLVVVVVNTLILLLMALLFPGRFAVDNLLWALVGGLVLGLLSSFLESLLGLSMPIVPDESAELRDRIEDQARRVHSFASTGSAAALENQVLAAEPEALGASAAEPAIPKPDEGPSPPMEVEAEPIDPTTAASVEAAVALDPKPVPEPRNEPEEDRS